MFLSEVVKCVLPKGLNIPIEFIMSYKHPLFASSIYEKEKYFPMSCSYKDATPTVTHDMSLPI